MANLDEAAMEKVRLLVPPNPIEIVDGVVQRKEHSLQKAINAIGMGRYQFGIGFATFLALMCDATNIIQVFILGHVLKCEWKLTDFEVALISGITFLGGAVSSVPWGVFCDKRGRRSGMLIGVIMTLCFGLLSTLSPNLVWFLIGRWLVGCMSAPFPLAISHFAEFLPTKYRGISLAFVQVGLCFGVLLGILISMVFLPNFGWRWYLLISHFPLLLFACMFIWLPESPFFYVARGRAEEASASVKRLADENQRIGIPGNIRIDEESRSIGHMLCRADIAYLTSQVAYLGFAITTVFIGISLLATKVYWHQTSLNEVGVKLIHDNTTCEEVDGTHYTKMLLVSGVDAAGVLFALLIVEVLGRKGSLIGGSFLFAVVLATLMFLFKSWVATLVLLLVSKALATSCIVLVNIYIPEVFPTAIRCTGAGFSFALAKAGIVVSPLISKLLFSVTPEGALGLFVLISLVFIMVTPALPFETKGKNLMTTIETQHTLDDDDDFLEIEK